jgi:hypothetical protein
MTLPFSKQRFLVRFLFTVTVLFAENLYGQQAKPSVFWPTSFKLKRPAIIKLVQKGSEDRGYIYRTKHFELHSPEALSEHTLSQFATTAESVPSVLNRLPLPLLGMPVDKSGKPVLAKVLIYPNEISFVKAGGAKVTAGYYDGWKQAILLRADTFLKPPRQSWH